MENKNITIEGRIYELVERHRPNIENDSKLYKGDDSFVRVGNAEKIESNLELHKNLEKAGFPVSQILEIGTIGDKKYFIEQSLGEKILRLQFAEEVASAGKISDESLNAFMKIMRLYLEAQAKSILPANTSLFIERTNLDKLCKELPEYTTKIRAKADEHLESLSKFPFVLSHGDLSPNNMFPEGVIDLEDSLPAPFGYDAVCALITSDWYPAGVDFEFEVTFYDFTKEQRQEYLDMCDVVSSQAGLPKISEFINDFSFFRAVWLTEGLNEWPKTKKYRYERFIREYLD